MSAGQARGRLPGEQATQTLPSASLNVANTAVGVDDGHLDGFLERPAQVDGAVDGCPPLFGLLEYHVVVTTPYILTESTETDWTAYLNKLLLEGGDAETNHDLHGLMKFGKSPRNWHEFVLLAYHRHQPDAIFLAGLPDAMGSLPHAT